MSEHPSGTTPRLFQAHPARCQTCGRQEPEVRFNPRRPSAFCEACRGKKDRERNPEATRRNWRRAHLKKTYGITEQDEQWMLENQAWKCAICETVLNEVARLRHIDHCHDTGAVRGILCPNCNYMIGRAKDSEELLSAAIGYLRNPPGLNHAEEKAA